jgi:hypothetical protein
MEDWLRRVWEKGRSPYVRALGLFVLLLFCELGLVSTLSDVGFAAEVQQYRGFVWAGTIVIALFGAITWLWRQLVQRRKSVFFRDAQGGTTYLMDLSGKLREIPDTHTFTYLVHVLGVSESALEVQGEEIDGLRGKEIVPVREWEPPLSPEEKAKREVWRRVSRALEKTVSRFEGNADPQKLVIGITNRSRDMFLHIRHVKFQHHKLPYEALLSCYRTPGASYVAIPFDKSTADLAPGGNFPVELELRQKWEPSDIERMKGELGFLVLEGILIQV